MTEAGSRQHAGGKLAGGEREWGGKYLGKRREGGGKDEILHTVAHAPPARHNRCGRSGTEDW